MPSDKGINIFTIVGRVLGLVPDPPKKAVVIILYYFSSL